MRALSRLAWRKEGNKPAVLLTTVNAILQRVPPREAVARQALSAAPGKLLSMASVTQWLELNGFNRAATVREPGDYAVRGGIIDLFAPAIDAPVRLDFFGDTLESIRSFDPETQRTAEELRALELVPMAEFQLTSDTIRRFRTGYVATFGAASPDDMLYEAVSEGRRAAGMEHWLPLFHEQMATLFDYLGGETATPIILEPLAEEAAHERLTQIADYFQARKDALDHPEKGASGAVYKPLPPDRLYLAEAEWRARLDRVPLARLSPFAAPEDTADAIDVAARAGRNFAAERSDPNANVFDAVRTHAEALQAAGKRVVVALWSEGSRERMAHVLAEHRLLNLAMVESWPAALARPRHEASLAVLGLESGFETADVALITEEDILGERLIRPRKQGKRPENFIAEVTSLSTGDVVVHVDHGIGRFVGLRAIEAAGAPHDCLEIHYAGGDKLFLPVENIELLSRYGSEAAGVELDRLGSTAWQARKSRMKNRIREIAGELIKVAAARALHEAPRLTLETGVYDEFSARFPYDETDDQQAAISAVMDDLVLRAADGPAHLRRRRFRQNRSGAARRLRHRHERQAGRGGGADDAARPPALQDLLRAAARLSGEDRAGLAAHFGERTGAGEKGPCRRRHRYCRRHPRAPRQDHKIQGPRADCGRRGAAFRRRSQREAQAASRRGARADADRDADPAHPATGALGRARNVDHRHAAGRSPCRSHFRRAVRSDCGARGAACASAIAAGNRSTSARASRTSPRPKRSSTSTCPKCASPSPTGRCRRRCSKT